jgi:hypothetical protein
LAAFWRQNGGVGCLCVANYGIANVFGRKDGSLGGIQRLQILIKVPLLLNTVL